MKSKDVFNVAVRIIGLIFLYQGLVAVPNVAGAIYQTLFPRFYFRFLMTTLFSGLFTIGWPLLLAWWMIRGAPRLMRLAYPEERSGEERPVG